MAPQRLEFTDRTRCIKPGMGFAGSAERRLEALAWVPDSDALAGPWPLALYCHGTDGSADNATWLAGALAADGWLVVAPFFPLTSPATHTRVAGPDISDAGEQVRDVAFLIDSLLADPAWAARIDAARIVVLGHSLGAITCWHAAYSAATRDPRIAAAVMLGAGDPVVAAQHAGIGLADAGPVTGNVPGLLVSADKDLFSRMMGPPGTAFPRLPGPKCEVTIRGGVHVWFHDGDAWPADHRNPDALWFAARSPDMAVPGSEERVPLIGPQRQREITWAAVRAFLDGHVRGDAGALERLRGLGMAFDEAAVTLAEG
ncbi:MAG: hypothetical protein KGM17_08610 [Sphingomonadales bacterium]|nr:hypothetical protein [Sphingomonadales bacterium]